MANNANHIAVNLDAGSGGTTVPHADGARTEGLYVQSWPALIDKYLLSPIHSAGKGMIVTVLLLLPAISDDMAGRTEDPSSLLWSVEKGLVLVFLFAVPVVVPVIVSRAYRWLSRRLTRRKRS
jgi:hypothetical protein